MASITCSQPQRRLCASWRRRRCGGEGLVREQPVDRGAKCLRVAWWNEEASFPVDDHVRQASNGRRDDGASVSHRLRTGEWEAIAA